MNAGVGDASLEIERKLINFFRNFQSGSGFYSVYLDRDVVEVMLAFVDVEFIAFVVVELVNEAVGLLTAGKM